MLSHLPVIMKIENPWLLRKKQPHIDGKEFKKKNKRTCFETVSKGEVRLVHGMLES